MRQTEIELKFLVPARARAKLAAEMARGSGALGRTSLAAMYLDCKDRRLAREGIAWRLRREGRRWVQALKLGGSNPLERFEHEVTRPDARYDATLHAGTPAGDRLIALLRLAQADGVELGVRFRTEVRRCARTIRTRGAVVEVAFDEGRLVAAGSTQRIREVEFELRSGSTTAMLLLAERWRKRFGLVYDPCSKAERGDRLAQGSPFPALRKAILPSYGPAATATEAFGSVLDECLAHISRNAVGVIGGDPQGRVEHVHQLRIGMRRLSTALRSFQGWVPPPPTELVEGLRRLFAALGMARDNDVLNSGVLAELAKAGAPPLALTAAAAGPDPAELVGGAPTQQLLLAWISWRASLVQEHNGTVTEAPTLQRQAERRLRRWHRRIVAEGRAFDRLDEAELHALRKRIKRQRYAVEFFAPLLRRRAVERYLQALTEVQDRMGELADLFVARARYQPLAADAAAWFAFGWLAARIADVRALAQPGLRQLASMDPPTS